MSSDKLYSDAVRSGLSSDEDVASPVASPIITGVSKKVFLQKSQTLNSETIETGNVTTSNFYFKLLFRVRLKKIWKAFVKLEARDYFERGIVYKEFCLS